VEQHYFAALAAGIEIFCGSGSRFFSGDSSQEGLEKM
jgi:hypothetical protein